MSRTDFADKYLGKDPAYDFCLASQEWPGFRGMRKHDWSTGGVRIAKAIRDERLTRAINFRNSPHPLVHPYVSAAYILGLEPIYE